MVASDGVRAMMESALTARDRVGVQDFVLLENYTSEAAFIENLRKRFKENLIYVSGRGHVYCYHKDGDLCPSTLHKDLFTF